MAEVKTNEPMLVKAKVSDVVRRGVDTNVRYVFRLDTEVPRMNYGETVMEKELNLSRGNAIRIVCESDSRIARFLNYKIEKNKFDCTVLATLVSDAEITVQCTHHDEGDEVEADGSTYIYQQECWIYNIVDIKLAPETEANLSGWTKRHGASVFDD